MKDESNWSERVKITCQRYKKRSTTNGEGEMTQVKMWTIQPESEARNCSLLNYYAYVAV